MFGNPCVGTLRSVSCRRPKHRGGVLVSTLIFVVITAFIMAGIGTYTISHLSRASAEADYSASINLAEAGVNYELRNISEDVGNSTRANQMHPAAGQNGAYSGSISGINGTFSVAVTNNPDNGKAWYAPSNMLITATGTLNGVTRTVRVQGARRSVFDNYSFYGIDSTTINGNLVADGSFGTNSPVTLNGSSAEVYGPVVFNGTSGSFSAGQATGGVWYQPDKISWPTVSQMADATASTKSGSKVTTGTGLAWIKLHNDNAQIMQFSSTDATLTNPTQHSWVSAGLTADSNGNWAIGNKSGLNTFKNLTTDANPMDAAGATTPRYDQAAVTYTFTNPSNTVSQAEQDINGCEVLILPGSPTSTPYNYYFDEIDLSGSSKVAILVDNATGPVNLWLGSSTAYGSSQDNINGTWLFTAPGDSTKFRLYDAKSGTFDMQGNSVFPGGIYVYNGSGTGTVNLHGNPILDGSIIADSLKVSGSPFINYPTNMQATNDYSLWYGFLNQWTEVSGM